MNRRGFLNRLGAAVVGLASHRLLPGIVPPAPVVPAAPTLWVTDKTLGLSMRVIQHYDPHYSEFGAKPGVTIHVRKPARYS